VRVIFDIETNGLYYKATKLHCISLKVDENPIEVYTSSPIKGSSGNLSKAIALLNQADLVVGHNIINFDIPMLKKLGFAVKPKELFDTLIASKLSFPNIIDTDVFKTHIPPKLKGRHSLKAWGYRLNKLKGEFGDEEEHWKMLTEDMVEYARQDIVVTEAVYNLILTKDIPAKAMELEQAFATIISRQEKYGVYFDVKAAQKLHIELLEEVDKAEEELCKVFKPLKTWEAKAYPKVSAKKDGTKSKILRTQEALGCHFNEKMEWGKYTYVQFKPTSRQHISRWLQELYGWKPTKFTGKGSVIIDEDVLNELEFPEGKILAHYFNVKKLIGQLAGGKNAWLKMVDSSGRIHGSVDTLGAVSRRCTHSTPNMAQVPSSRAYKGHESRALFTVPKGKKLVGCDADGLELRTLSHYMAVYDKGVYARAVDEGKKENGTDIHTVNQNGAGLPTRDDAKTFIYAFLYGAGDEMLGKIVGGTAKEGKALKAKFFRKIPAIKALIDAVSAKVKKDNTIKALDGNPYHIRSSHSALNTLLQGAGAVVMKYYLVALDNNLVRRGFTNSATTSNPDYEFVLNVHDEVQIECSESIAEEVASIAIKSFDDVTELLKFRIPLRGSAAVGNSWADTH